MRFALHTLTTLLKKLEGRKDLSSSDSTHIPNTSAHRNPRFAARSRTARLHAVENAARLQRHRSTANGTADTTENISTASTGAADGEKPRGTKYRRAKTRRHAGKKALQRCNTALVPQPPTHPHPPGAFIVEPSFIVPGFPELDDRNLPPFVAQKIFFDSLEAGREALIRAEWDREERQRIEEEAESARLFEEEKKAAY